MTFDVGSVGAQAYRPRLLKWGNHVRLISLCIPDSQQDFLSHSLSL